VGRLYRRHKEGNWYGDYTTPEGKRIQGSLRTKDKQVAKERLRIAELGATPDSRGKKQRLMDAIEAAIQSMHNKAEPTREMYRQKGRRLLKSLGNPFVSDINLKMLDAYIELRRSDDTEHGGAADHTIQKELITIRRALKHSMRTKHLHALPAWPEFSANYEPRKTWLTPAQFDLVCGELEAKRRLWACLAALGGMRAGEVERLEWTHLGEKLMAVPGTKTESSKRRVPIAPALRHRLDAVPKAARTGLVVEHWGNVRRDLHAAVTRANQKQPSDAQPLPMVSPNDLRRTFASWLVQNGVPLLTVAALMGHKSTRMLEKVYGQLSARNLEEAIAMLPRGVTDGVTEPVSNLLTPDHTGHSNDEPSDD
jgi:integrase